MTRCILTLGSVLISTSIASAQATEEQHGTVNGPALLKMLQDLALQPAQPDKQAETYRLIVNRDEFRGLVQLTLSPDQRTIWFSSWSTKFARSEEETLTEAVQLLEKNTQIAPAQFTYSTTSQTVYLSLPVANRDMTSDRLRQEVASFADLVKRTCPQWKVAR